MPSEKPLVLITDYLEEAGVENPVLENHAEVKILNTHTDTDMSSAEELAKMEAEKANASADIAEVGIEFGPIAQKKGISAPYKPATWDKIPDWAKGTELLYIPARA